MTADLLRRAAAKIRETAQAADREAPAPWRADPPGVGDARPADTYDVLDAESFDVGNEVSITSPEAKHVALWSPDVAELVAVLLESEANEADALKGYAPEEVVALARRILGEDS